MRGDARRCCHAGICYSMLAAAFSDMIFLPFFTFLRQRAMPCRHYLPLLTRHIHALFDGARGLCCVRYADMFCAARRTTYDAFFTLYAFIIY